jgi:hypothetical protein
LSSQLFGGLYFSHLPPGRTQNGLIISFLERTTPTSVFSEIFVTSTLVNCILGWNDIPWGEYADLKINIIKAASIRKVDETDVKALVDYVFENGRN